jgi:two-component system sensor histidine kinase RegB
MHSQDSVFGLHILGMWFNFFASALIIVVFLTRLALMLRARERELVAAREAGLRSEQVLALGTLAAGAAHQLGTPLSTMAVVLRELEIEHAGEGSLPESLALLRHQVDRCKGLLSELLSQAGQPRSEASGERGLNDLLEDLADQWRLLRPQTVLRSTLLTEGPAPRIPADPSLQRAILNLLDNAADASPDEILMTARWDKRGEALRCTIEILDRGPGLNAAGAQRIGQPFVTTKSEQGGLGIGLFLSHATLERFGGSLELLERPGGGTCSRITLPGRWNPK